MQGQGEIAESSNRGWEAWTQGTGPMWVVKEKEPLITTLEPHLERTTFDVLVYAEKSSLEEVQASILVLCPYQFK